MKFAKFLRTPCFTEYHLPWLLLKVSSFQPATLLKKRLRQRCFFVNFSRFLRTCLLLTKHLRLTASCVYLWILRTPPGNCYFINKVAEFQPPGAAKIISQVLFNHFIQEREVAIRRRSFTGCDMPTWKFRKKNSPHVSLTSSFMYFAFIFQNASWLLFPKRLQKCANTISFRKYRRKVVLLIIYLFNYDSSKSIIFMLNTAFDFLLSTALVK